MAAFSNVNAKGDPLNQVGAVQDDEDARNLAAHLRGPRRDPYYEPMRSLSSQDEEVHEVYEALYDIVNNPENYTAEQINDTIVDILEENDSPVQKYGSFSGNYNADLADERNSPEVFKYYKSWKRNHKNWERRGKEMKGKKLAELKKLDKYKTPDDMPRDKKRKIRDELYEEVNEVYRKYMYGKVPLGRQIYYMIEKAEKIQEKKELGSDSDSSDDEDGGAAAVMKKPSSTEFEKMNNDEKEAAKRKKLAPLLAKMKLGSLKKSSAKPSVAMAKPAAVAMAKPAATTKPSVKEMFGDKWIGPYMSKSRGIKYWVRMRDRLGVFVDSKTGELTERNIRKTEEHQAKKAAKKGGRRTRKKRGGDQGNAPVTFIVSNDNITITQFNENIKERQNIDLTFIKGNSYNGRDAIANEMRNSGLIGGWFIIKYDPNSENNAQFGHWKRNAFVDDEYPEQANEIIAEDNIKIGDRFVIQTPDQIGGRRKKKKSRKKRGGRKLNLFLSEINNRLRDVEERGEEREDEIRSNSAEIRDNDAAIIGNGNEITENAVDIGVIRSYINYKLNNTIENAATPLDQWQGHLRSIDRRSHQERRSLIDRQTLTDANMSGGMKKTRKMKGGHHLYKRLGVSKYASQKQIKKAYNKIKKKKKLTKKVKYAYKILSKKKSRKKYNAKYKKMKKSKKKRRRRGGIASIVIKGKMHPDNYEPQFNIPDPNASQPAWLGNL